MEFFLGVLFSAVLGSSVYYFIYKNPPIKPHRLQISQSRHFSNIGFLLALPMSIPEKRESQSVKYDAKNSVKIVFHGSLAYWISDNTFFVADVVDGQIDASTQKKVDTIGVDKVELEKLSSIVDILTEGDADDRSGPGNKRF
jgi:hypothetical protein